MHILSILPVACAVTDFVLLQRLTNSLHLVCAQAPYQAQAQAGFQSDNYPKDRRAARGSESVLIPSRLAKKVYDCNGCLFGGIVVVFREEYELYVLALGSPSGWAEQTHGDTRGRQLLSSRGIALIHSSALLSSLPPVLLHVCREKPSRLHGLWACPRATGWALPFSVSRHAL